MKKIATMMAAVTLMSACATDPYYFVAKKIDDGTYGVYREKRNLDANIAEDGREWNIGWPSITPGDCEIRRELRPGFFSKVKHSYHSKRDIECVVWDATDGPERERRFVIGQPSEPLNY